MDLTPPYQHSMLSWMLPKAQGLNLFRGARECVSFVHIAIAM